MSYVPEWIQKEVRDKYKSAVANAFILTGNISDYCTENRELKEYLCSFITGTGDEDMRMENVYFFDIEALGRRVYPRPTDSKEESNIGWTEFIDKIGKEKRSAFVILYPEFLIPEDNQIRDPNQQAMVVSLHKLLNSAEFINSNNTVFIIAESVKDLHSKFVGSNSRTVMCEIPLPGAESREAFIRYYFEKKFQEETNGAYYKNCVKSWGLPIDEMVNLTAGLQLVAIEDVLLTAFTRERKKKEGKLPADTVCMSRQVIMDRKKEVIQKEYSDVIEIFDTAGFNLDNYAGQEELKQYFKEVVIESFHNSEMTSIAPKGIIMMGPPGTGKTYFAKCVAGDAGINFLEFKMSKILGKYVGESEKSMERALSVFRALAPVGVFIDEIDQAFPARNQGVGESGVSANLFGMLLAEMSKPENRGRILWLGATNYPNNVDEALKRSGRFDKKIPFFAPNEKERRDVFAYHLKKRGFRTDNEAQMSEIVEKTKDYTQAEIEGVVVKAEELAKRRRDDKSDLKCVLDAADYIMSAQNAKIRDMEDMALVECNDAEFIPEDRRERQRELLHLNPKASEIETNPDRRSETR